LKREHGRGKALVVQDLWVWQEWGLAHTERYHEAVAASSNYFDIIRMKREGVEKAGVAGLMRGVQEMGIRGGKREVLGKEGGARRWRKSQNPHASKTDAVPRPCPVIRGLPPPSTSPCAAKYLKKCNIELKLIETTLLDIPARLS